MADRKPKAARVPPAKATPPPHEKTQRERFEEAGREAGVTEEMLDKALGKLAPPKRKSNGPRLPPGP